MNDTGTAIKVCFFVAKMAGVPSDAANAKCEGTTRA